MSAVSHCPELVPLSRFTSVLANDTMMKQIVGDTYAVLSVDLDTAPALRMSVQADDDCEEVFALRLRMAIPSDALITRLRHGTFGILAFGIREVVDALEFARQLHAQIRAPVALGHCELRLSASVGISFARPGVRALRAMEEAEIAAARVRLNGGDATFVANPAPAQGISLSSINWRKLVAAPH